MRRCNRDHQGDDRSQHVHREESPRASHGFAEQVANSRARYHQRLGQHSEEMLTPSAASMNVCMFSFRATQFTSNTTSSRRGWLV